MELRERAGLLGSVRSQVTQALRVERGGLVTKMMNVTGPRKLQRKPCLRSSQQLDEKRGVWSGA